MSRCLRYSSFYARNGSPNDPLIHSVKDEKKKRERNGEPRAEKRQRKQECGNSGRHHSDHKKHKPGSGFGKDGRPVNQKPETEARHESRSKKRRIEKPPSPHTLHKLEESELLEKSALTEENGLPTHLPNFTSSNSQVLPKLARPVSPVAVSGLPPGGPFNKIRIRMQPQGFTQKADDSRPPLCSTSGRVVGPEPEPEPEPKPERVVRSAQEKIRTRLSRLCGGVFGMDFLPVSRADPDGEDWLFGGPGCNRERDVEKSSIVASRSPPSDGGHIQWPKACYHREGCIYVMPYVVPY